MKRTIKSAMLLTVLAVILFALTGCGNKLVATKTESDSMFGEYKETVEVSFKKDKADKIKITMEFESEDNAESIASLYKLAGDSVDGLEVEQKDKKVIITMDPETFADEEGLDDSDLTKDSIKKSLEEAGYTVK